MSSRWARVLALLGLALAAAGCRRKAPPPPPPAGTTVSVVSSAEPPSALRFEPDPALRPGVPRGCALVERPMSAQVGPPEPLFFAPDEPRDELIVRLPGTTRAGVMPLRGGAPRPILHVEGAPPFFAATSTGWQQLFHAPGQLLWASEGQRPEVVLEGEELEATDLRCRGDRCAALSTRALRVAASGATVLLGRAGQPASAWQRVDLTPTGAAPERPFVVAAVSEATTTVTTTSSEGVQFFELRAGEVTPGPRLPAPHGALEALKLQEALVVAHGSQLTGDCATPRPRLALVRSQGEPQVIDVDAPPLSLFARPLARGAVLAWLTPTHCGDRLRRIAYLALVDESGTLRTTPMAVTEATGLALATAGERVDLWLRRGERVAWLRMRCEGLRHAASVLSSRTCPRKLPIPRSRPSSPATWSPVATRSSASWGAEAWGLFTCARIWSPTTGWP